MSFRFSEETDPIVRPELQRVVVRSIQGLPDGEETVEEALEIAFGFEDAVDAPTLLEALLAEVGIDAHEYEERKSGGEWGASFPGVQEILLSIGSDLTAAGVVVALTALVQTVRRRRTNAETSEVPPIESEGRPAPRSADEAAEIFLTHLASAYHISNAQLLEVTFEKAEDVWVIRAESTRFRYRGVLSRDGRILQSRRVGSR